MTENEFRHMLAATPAGQRLASAFQGLAKTSEGAKEAIRRMQLIMEADCSTYRAKWARKRKSRYLAKGGVRK